MPRQSFRRRPYRNAPGFTLVELMLAVAMTGIVVAAMYGLFLSMKRTTAKQEGVIDLQQGVRVALNQLGRDIQMAGLLIPQTTPPVDAEKYTLSGVTDFASNANVLTLVTASDRYIFGQLREMEQIAVTTSGTDPGYLKLRVPEMADRFESGDRVRVIRPQDGSQPAVSPTCTGELTVAGKNRNSTTNDPDTGSPYGAVLRVQGFSPTETFVYVPGDVVVRVTPGAEFPQRIQWRLQGTNLVRTVINDPADPDDDEAAQLILEDVDALAFRYFDKLGREIPYPTDATLPPEIDDTAESIRAIEVTITVGKDLVQSTGGALQAVTRSLTGAFKLRNHSRWQSSM